MNSGKNRIMLVPNKDSMFKYLDGLRASGAVNMMGAGSYLEAEFGLDKGGARETVLEWMETFTDRSATDPEFLTES